MAKKDIKDHADTPTGWADRWADEFAAAKPAMDKFHKAGEKVLKVFLGDLGMKDDRVSDERLNLFYANIITVQSIMFGNLPKAEVDRKFADAEDDVARVGAEILERILNQDIQNPGNDLRSILTQVLSDRLLPGLGSARIRYDYTSDIQVIAPEIPPVLHPLTGQTIVEGQPEQTGEKVTDEWVDVVYTHWKDFKWSPARTHAEIRWKAFRSYMDKKELTKRFGPDSDAEYDIKIEDIPLNSKGPFGRDDRNSDQKTVKPQAEVWEIYNIEDRKVYWYVEGFDTILDCKDDPLELDQFWPDPPPLVANLTTSRFLPKSDYAMMQDLYSAIDVLETRIARLTEACKLVGVYDKANDEIKRVFQEGVENQLIPVDNWAMFAEKGGLQGNIEWLPIEDVVKVIEQLQQLQQAKIGQLYELMGLADILRGASQQAYTSAEETKAKTMYASVRLQRLQDEFAIWVANLQNLKVEVICRYFDPQTIIKQSNILMSYDAELAQKAVEFLKSDETRKFRIIVQPESMAAADYQQLKQDRTDFLMAISQFMQSAAPLLQLDPGAQPYLLQMLKWGLAGFKGAQEIEGVMDQAIKVALADAKKKASQPPKPTPDEIKSQQIQAEGQMKLQILQAQAQADAAREQQKQAMELERAQADHQSELEKIQQNRALEQQKFEMQMEILKAQLIVNLAKLNAQQKADVSSQAIDMIHHAEQTKMDAAADTHAATLNAAVDNQKTQNAMALTSHQTDKAKEAATHAAKVQVQSKDKGNGASK